MESVFWRDNSKPCDFPLNRFCLVLWLDEASKHFFKSKVVGYNQSMYFDWNFETILYYLDAGVGVYHILITQNEGFIFHCFTHTVNLENGVWSWIPTEFLHAEIYASFVVWTVGINAMKISAFV